MSAKAPEESDEDYYGPIANRYPRLGNAEAIKSYGTNTEPSGGKPRKTRVLTTAAFRKIQLDFLANLSKDIIRNAPLSWQWGTALFSEDRRDQPLGDYPEKLYDEP